MVWKVSSLVRPMALSTWDGSTLTVEHAEPAEKESLLFGHGKFLTGCQPFLFFKSLFYQFKFTSLHGKIRLGKGNLHLARVTVLSDQVAGVAGQHANAAHGATVIVHGDDDAPESLITNRRILEEC